MINFSKSIKKRINMKKEVLEKQLENQLERYEHAVDLPYFNEETGEKMAFVRDGIVEVAEYLKAPIKILWILKEANSQDENSLDDMRPCLKTLNEKNNNIDPEWGYTWRPIAYAMYGVFEDVNYKDIPLMNGNASEVVKHMSKIVPIRPETPPSDLFVCLQANKRAKCTTNRAFTLCGISKQSKKQPPAAFFRVARYYSYLAGY